MLKRSVKAATMIKLISKILIFVLFCEILSPVMPQITIGAPEAYAANYVCAQDLNKDGAIDGPGETATCASTPQGQLCPISAVNCAPSQSGDVSCSGGGTYNSTTGKCELAPTAINCPSGFTYDNAAGLCLQNVACPSGGLLNSNTDKCEVTLTNAVCPSSFTISPIADGCLADAVCSLNGTFNSSTGKCELPGGIACPNGYTYNLISKQCEMTPVCPQGAAYNINADKCATASFLACSGNGAYNPGLNLCQGAPLCSNGGIYNAATGKCELAIMNNCPSGYSYNAGIGKCEGTPTCPVGGSYNAANDICEGSYFNTYQCTFNGIIYGSSNSCTSNCLQICSTLYNCPSGYGWSVGYGSTCIANAICPSGGTLNGVTDKCEIASTQTCPSGYSISGGLCVAAFSCSSGYVWNAATAKCEAAASQSCQSGFTYDAGLGVCVSNASCTSGGTLDTALDVCKLAGSPGCSAGYTYNATSAKCEAAPICSTGAFDAVYSKCKVSISSFCPSGYAYRSMAVCDQSPPCPSGSSYSATIDKCTATASINCPFGYTFAQSVNLCTMTPTCTVTGSCNSVSVPYTQYQCSSTGSVYGDTGTCSANCQSCSTTTNYYKQRTGGCTYPFSTNNPYCSSGICAPSASEGVPGGAQYIGRGNEGVPDPCYYFNPESNAYWLVNFDYYAKDVTTCSPASCNPITSYSTQYQCSLTGSNYGTSAACSSSCTSTGACVQQYACPLGPQAQYPCMNNNGTMQCSPNTCMDLDANPPQITQVDDTMLQNDGARGADGSCLGTVYLFSGRGMRCRPKGMTVGYGGNCCANKNNKTVSDSIGQLQNVKMVAGAVSGIFQMVKTGYYITKAADIISVAGSGTTATLTGSTLTVQGIYGCESLSAGSFSLSGQAVEGVQKGTEILKSGGSLNDAMNAGLQTTVVNLVKGAAPSLVGAAVAQLTGSQTAGGAAQLVTTLALGGSPILASVGLVMGIYSDFFTSKCDQQDIETAILNSSKYCHYVGDYCEKKWSLLGCIQKAKGYCCFNSKLARIIHEQGRPQLQAFSPGGNWGKGGSPNCKGFTPEEFQMLDFSQIDMSEYFEEIKTKAVETIQQNATQKIEQYYQSIRK